MTGEIRQMRYPDQGLSMIEYDSLRAGEGSPTSASTRRGGTALLEQHPQPCPGFRSWWSGPRCLSDGLPTCPAMRPAPRISRRGPRGPFPGVVDPGDGLCPRLEDLAEPAKVGFEYRETCGVPKRSIGA